MAWPTGWAPEFVIFPTELIPDLPLHWQPDAAKYQSWGERHAVPWTQQKEYEHDW